MKQRISRRFVSLAAAASIPIFSLSIVSPAQALTAPASSAAEWLSHQLTNGLAHNDQYNFDDYGLSLDIFIALDTLGAKSASADSVISAFRTDPGAYTTGEAFGDSGSIYAGQTGKLASVVQLAGENPSSFGGRNLIADLVGLVDSDGRAKDVSPVFGGEYSNAIGQGWVVRALSAAHSARAEDVTSYLLKQQCDNGSFRQELSNTQCTTGSGQVDATAFAIQALNVAKNNGGAGLSDDIADGVGWLSSTQASSGAFSDAGSFNTNSTGLVASVLADHGQKARAQRAAKWIIGHQVTSSNAGKTPLKTEVGAIAYDAAALTAGKSAGITVPLRDQWRRATAQAAIGINIVLPTTPPSSGHGGASSGGSSDRRSSAGVGGTSGLHSADITENPKPEATAVPASTPTPDPTPIQGPDTTSAAPKAEESGRSSTGWIIAGVAGALMLATLGAVGIGRLRGGGAS